MSGLSAGHGISNTPRNPAISKCNDSSGLLSLTCSVFQEPPHTSNHAHHLWSSRPWQPSTSAATFVDKRHLCLASRRHTLVRLWRFRRWRCTRNCPSARKVSRYPRWCTLCRRDLQAIGLQSRMAGCRRRPRRPEWKATRSHRHWPYAEPSSRRKSSFECRC